MRFSWHHAAGIILYVCGAALLVQAQQIGGGTITTVAGTGVKGLSGDNGPATQAQLNFITGDPNVEDDFGHIAVDASGNLLIVDKANHRIRKVDRSGIITTIAGSTQGSGGDGGPASRALLNFPCGIAVDRAGNILITEEDNNRIRKIDTSGNISTVAGSGAQSFGGDNGPATSASFDGPCAVASDAAGNIYIADTFNDRVRKVAAGSGIITTIAGNGKHGDDNNKCDGVPAVLNDGVLATSLCLGWPSGVALDSSGNNLFISDHHNNLVRVVDLQSGLIRRIAGTGVHSDENPAGDGRPATEAALGFPMGLAFDTDGNLYVADMHNHAIRRISNPLRPGAIISTPVASGRIGLAGDGGPASAAQLHSPTGLAIDSAGNMYIADWYNDRVRKVTPGSGSTRPQIFDGGLVNGASFAPPPARVSAGSIVSLFGSRLAPGQAVADTLPLPISLLQPPVSVTVTSGGSTFFLPLFFVSPGQINAQLPVELPATGQATVIARVGDTLSDPVTINLSPSETGIFIVPNSNHAVALNQDNSLNTSTQGAARGSTIVVFLTGEGELRPHIPTGQPAPTDPLSQTPGERSATIAGLPARVNFLGATPGFVGLSQANIVVPDNAPLGDQVLVITVFGHESNRPLITVR